MAEDPQTPSQPEPQAVATTEPAAPPAPDAPEQSPKETEEKPSEETEEKKPEAVEADPEPVDAEKKALDELKQLVVAAIANNEFNPPPPPPPPAVSEAKVEESKSDDKPEAPFAEPPAEDAPKAESSDTSAAPPAVEEEAKEVEAAEKAVNVVEDGAKTAEAVEETVAASATAEVTSEVPADEPKAEAVEVAVVEEEPKAVVAPEEVFIWGVPLVGDERSDTVLLKFLRAREFKVKEAFEMLKNTVLWRKQFGIEALLDEDLGLPELNKTVFMHGFDKEEHPVCYNVFGEFQNAELYEKVFGDAEKREKFLKWRIQYLEKGIREGLDFQPGGICSMVQVTDLKNSPWRGKHRQVMNQAVTLLQDNYPEFIATKVFINVPWWNLAYYRMMSSVFTPRTKSKFVFAGPSKSAETLFKYIAPEQVPVAYGGLSQENDADFTTSDAVTEVTIKPTSKQSVEIPATEPCLLTWELRVIGWEVNYGAEFVPSAEEGYTVIVQKSRKLIATDEPIIKTSFKIGEAGKIVLNFENPTSKKKKLLYRFKVKSSAE